MRVLSRIMNLICVVMLVAGSFAQVLANSSVGTAYTVQKRDVINTVTLGGTLIPAREVTFAAQMPGRINMIAGEEGDTFDEENLLIALDDTELLAQRRAAWAEMIKAEATLRDAGVQYSKERWAPDSITKAPGGMGMPYMFDQMFTEGASDAIGRGDSTLDREAALHQYSTKLDQARSALLATRAQIDAIDAKLRDARSIAPFNGVITKKLVEVGDTVQPGMPLLKFADVSQLQIRVEVPARLISGLQPGMLVQARLDVGGWGTVRVAQIFPIADPERHTVTAKFDMPPGVRAWPGQYAQVRLWDLSERKQQIVIPLSAVVQRGSLPSVYVLQNNKRELRMVRTGEEGTDQNGRKEVMILSGLREGEIIELNPPLYAASGALETGTDR